MWCLRFKKYTIENLFVSDNEEVLKAQEALSDESESEMYEIEEQSHNGRFRLVKKSSSVWMLY